MTAESVPRRFGLDAVCQNGMSAGGVVGVGGFAGDEFMVYAHRLTMNFK